MNLRYELAADKRLLTQGQRRLHISCSNEENPGHPRSASGRICAKAAQFQLAIWQPTYLWDRDDTWNAQPLNLDVFLSSFSRTQ